MVIVWLMMVNNNLVGGVSTPLKKKNKYQLGLLFPIYWVTLFLAQIDDDVLGKNKRWFDGDSPSGND